MTNNSKWYDPLYNLIEDHVEILDRALATKRGASKELQPDNHQAILGEYMLMAQEYLTAEEQKDLFQLTCLTSAQRKEYIIYYQWRCAVDRELPQTRY
jgi:hypothetical protein